MKSKIAFVWSGITGRWGVWQDGLKKALEILEKEYDIKYIEPTDDLEPYDLLIYWESPVTILGANAKDYLRIKNAPNKKILLFSGGQINGEWVKGFDAVCIESKWDKDEFAKHGVETYTAFGVNTELMRPMKVEKVYDAIHHGTCAGWKRQHVVAEAFKEHALIIGREQPGDSFCFDESKRLGATVLKETYGDELVKLINESDILCQTSSMWGGGQRATLEAMACGIPVIVMEDSPKNREYIEEGGGGLVANPDSASILRAYDDIMSNYKMYSQKAWDYAQTHWTHFHYAMALKNVIKKFL